MEIGEELMEIGVDGVLVMSWRRIGKKKIINKKKKKGEERKAEIKIRMVWRRGYSEEKKGVDGVLVMGWRTRGRKKIQKKRKKNEEKEEGVIQRKKKG